MMQTNPGLVFLDIVLSWLWCLEPIGVVCECKGVVTTASPLRLL